ncbi:FecR family protein [Cohaesibacter intestini]|uniref:FecR family protein n=1 Tax=Cohaesibacter intestini TaxID=2211145 RepID=UPI0013008FCA|nr:FecR family protein [Cohaesibacter intestini]
MTRFPFLAALISAVFCLTQPVWAKDDIKASDTAWRISKVSGDAWIEVPNREKMRLMRNRVLFPGQTLITSDRTRLQLVHGKQRIQVGSNTVLALPLLQETDPSHTRILQTSGTIHLSVDKQSTKHFSVETPYMVAAVKGTQFTVSLGSGWADVRVHEGLVEVSNKLAKEVFDVAAGQAISMDLTALGRKTQHAVKMAFFDRGEDIVQGSSPSHPADQPQAVMDEPQGIVSMIGGMIAAMTLYVGGMINAVVQSVTGSITGLVVPLAQKVQSDGTLHFLILGLLAAVTLVCVIGFILYRRKRFRVDLSRTRL